jgi:hypothetical protein
LCSTGVSTGSADRCGFSGSRPLGGVGLATVTIAARFGELLSEIPQIRGVELGVPAGGGVQQALAVELADRRDDAVAFVLVVEKVGDLQTQVGPVEPGRDHGRVLQPQVLDDLPARHRRGGGRQCGDRR